MRVTLNAEQSLYVIDVGHGYTCLGFTICQNWTRDIAHELGRRDLEPTAFASLEAYGEYERALEAAREYAAHAGQALTCRLTPQLVGLERRYVQVMDEWGETRQFYVGRSTGFIPVHLELENEHSESGAAVSGAPFFWVSALGSGQRPVRTGAAARSHGHRAVSGARP